MSFLYQLNRETESRSRKNFKEKNNPTPKPEILVDVYVVEEGYVIKALLPGVVNEDLEIALEDDLRTLSITSKRIFDLEGQCEALSAECGWGELSRTIVLPKKIDAETVDAILHNGVLSITLSDYSE